MSDFKSLRYKSGLSFAQLAKELGYSERQLYRWDSGQAKPREAVLSALAGLGELSKIPKDGRVDFDFIDLFAGIGGLRKAFEGVGGRCVFTSEWDKYAQQTYAANYRDNRPISGDITQISTEEIPEHEVLVAGFPCQPFSIAGVSKKNSLGENHGFACDTQGTLFFDVARIIAAKRPKAFLLENVKNLKSHDKGKTFNIIMKTLEQELGYNVQYKIIDALHFLPQHRERIVIVGFREDTSFNFDDLFLKEKGLYKLGDILHPEDGTEKPERHYTVGQSATVSEKYTLSIKLWTYLQNYAAKHKAKGNGFGFGLASREDTTRTLSARYYKDGSEILVDRGEGLIPRRLTPRECARLMGYGDDFKIPVSDTQAYKQFGNSVAVPVFEAVARLMTPYIAKKVQYSTEERKTA